MAKKSESKRKDSTGADELLVAGKTSGRPKSGMSWRQIFFSCAIILHFSTIFVALGSNLIQSRLQQSLMSWLSPYLISTAQGYGTTPIELTHGEDFDFPVQLEYLQQGAGKWRRINSHGLSRATQTRWPHLMRTLGIVMQDDPEAEVIGEFLFRLVIVAESELKNVTAVRILQPDRLNFDEAKIAAEGGEELVGVKDFVLYQASVVRKGDAIVGLNPSQERYRSSAPDKPESDTNAGGGAKE